MSQSPSDGSRSLPRRLGATTRTFAAAFVAALTCTPLARGAIVARIFREHAAHARCIRLHESHGDPRAVSPTGDYGWFQINYRAWAGHVVSFYAHGRGVWIRLPRQRVQFKRVTFNSRLNTLIAWAISRGGTDWRPWSTARYC